MKCQEQKKALEVTLAEAKEDFTKKMDGLKTDLEDEIKNLDPDIDTEGIDAILKFDIRIHWELQTLKLHLPEVRLVDQKLILDLPQFTMKDKEIIFDVPTTVMVLKKTGQYPETHCKMVLKEIGFGIKTHVPECKVVWKDIKTHVPEIRMERKRIVIGLPEIKMGRTEMILGIPEFSMKLQEIKLHLPGITVKSIEAEARKTKEKAEEVEKKYRERSTNMANTFRETAKTRLVNPLSNLFECHRKDLYKQKDTALQKFDEVIENIKSSIERMKGMGVGGDNANLQFLEEKLKSFINQRATLARDFDQKIEEISKQEKDAIEKMIENVEN